MLKVAVLSRNLLKGGAEKQALLLAGLLSDGGMRVYVVNWSGNEIDTAYLDFIRDNGLDYFPLRGSFAARFISFLKLIRRNGISVCISYLTFPNLVAGIAKIFCRGLTTIGGIRNETLPFYKVVSERLVHNYLNDATVFNNYSARDKYSRKGFRADKIHVIHNSIVVPDLAKDSIRNGNEVIIVTLSRFVEQKDIPTALAAFRKLVDRNDGKNIIYTMIGYGPLESEIREMTNQLGISRSVRILINPPDIPSLLRGCDIFLTTSLFEGLSNSIMEAMAAGLPIVATDVGDNKYLVREGINGFLIPCRDPDAIADKTEILLQSESMREEFGTNSYKMIKEGFGKEKMLKDYLALFSGLNQI